MIVSAGIGVLLPAPRDNQRFRLVSLPGKHLQDVPLPRTLDPSTLKAMGTVVERPCPGLADLAPS